MTDEAIDDVLDGKYGDEIVFTEDGGMFLIPRDVVESMQKEPPKPDTLFGIPIVFERERKK